MTNDNFDKKTTEPRKTGDSKKSKKSQSKSSYIDIYLPLLGKITKLRQIDQMDQINHLRVELQTMYQDIMNKLSIYTSENDQSKNHQESISYLLCCYIDEAILSTDWGVAGKWIHDSFLSQHHPILGGEHFYNRLKECLDEPKDHKEELQLFFLLLSTGYLGKMRLLKEGPRHIADLRRRIYHNGIEPYTDSSFHFSVFHDLEMEKETNILSRAQKWSYPAAAGAILLTYIIYSILIQPDMQDVMIEFAKWEVKS